MGYLTQKRLESAIPAPDLKDALDDDRDGAADPGLLDEIIAASSNAVDAYLQSLYAVPFPEPFPAIVVEAAFVFCGEAIYARRPAGGRNPFSARADALRKILEQIGTGDRSLDAATPLAFTPGAAILDPSRIDNTTS